MAWCPLFVIHRSRAAWPRGTKANEARPQELTDIFEKLGPAILFMHRFIRQDMLTRILFSNRYTGTHVHSPPQGRPVVVHNKEILDQALGG
jgi:hypothetical protein